MLYVCKRTAYCFCVCFPAYLCSEALLFAPERAARAFGMHAFAKAEGMFSIKSRSLEEDLLNSQEFQDPFLFFPPLASRQGSREKRFFNVFFFCETQKEQGAE